MKPRLFAFTSFAILAIFATSCTPTCESGMLGDYSTSINVVREELDAQAVVSISSATEQTFAVDGDAEPASVVSSFEESARLSLGQRGSLIKEQGSLSFHDGDGLLLLEAHFDKAPFTADAQLVTSADPDGFSCVGPFDRLYSSLRVGLLGADETAGPNEEVDVVRDDVAYRLRVTRAYHGVAQTFSPPEAERELTIVDAVLTKRVDE